MYSELWNNQRRFLVCEKKLEAPYRLMLFILSRLICFFFCLFFYYSALFSQLGLTVKGTCVVVLHNGTWTISWNWHQLQCYRDSVLPDVQYRRAIYTEQIDEKERLLVVLFADVNTGGEVSNWANSSLCTTTPSVWLVCSSSTRLHSDVSQLLRIILFCFVCLRYRKSLEMFHLRPDIWCDLPEIWIYIMLKNWGLTYAYIQST